MTVAPSSPASGKPFAQLPSDSLWISTRASPRTTYRYIWYSSTPRASSAVGGGMTTSTAGGAKAAGDAIGDGGTAGDDAGSGDGTGGVASWTAPTNLPSGAPNSGHVSPTMNTRMPSTQTTMPIPPMVMIT